MHLILGSQSPRRREILSYFSLPFQQKTPLFDENTIAFQNNPEEYVCLLSEGKALALSAQFPQAAILTADTVVYQNGRVYPKPANVQEAYQALFELQGKWHSVFTGVCLHHEGKQFKQWEETRVLFNPLTPEEILHYHSKIHWADKAGGYAIQMAGGLVVKRIEGCYYNVMGLPINTVRELLKHIGIELWHYVR